MAGSSLAGVWVPGHISRCPGSLRNPARSSPLSTASQGSQCADSCPGGTTCNTEEGQGAAGQSLSPALSGRTENPLISHHPATCISRGSHFNLGCHHTFTHTLILHTSPMSASLPDKNLMELTENTQAGPSPEKGRSTPGENSHSAVSILSSWPGLHGPLTGRGDRGQRGSQWPPANPVTVTSSHQAPSTLVTHPWPLRGGRGSGCGGLAR